VNCRRNLRSGSFWKTAPTDTTSFYDGAAESMISDWWSGTLDSGVVECFRHIGVTRIHRRNWIVAAFS